MRVVLVGMLALAVAFGARVPDASAHVGATTPQATSFLARIAAVPRGLAARVVDGDQQLWLRVDPGLTVVVTGLRGEPYLRFSADGVAVNERSATWYLNRRFPVEPPGGVTVTTPPRWVAVASGRSYLWHEDRLHALAAAARAPGSGYVGTWAVPLRVDGRPGRITGRLWYAAPPSLVWFWPLVVAAACSWALVRVRRVRLEAPIGTATGLLTLAAVVVAHVGGDLHGRPGVTTGAVAGLAIWSLLSIACAVALLRGRTHQLGSVGAMALGLATGLGFVSTLTHGYVLAALPAALMRAMTVVALAGSLVLLVLIFFGQVRSASRLSGPGGRGRRARSPRA